MKEKLLENELEDVLKLINELEKENAELIKTYKQQLKLNKELKKNIDGVRKNGKNKQL